eukprot:gene11298-11448_t
MKLVKLLHELIKLPYDLPMDITEQKGRTEQQQQLPKRLELIHLLMMAADLAKKTADKWFLDIWTRVCRDHIEADPMRVPAVMDTTLGHSIPGRPELQLPGSPDWQVYANGLRIIRLHNPAAVIFPNTTSQVQGAVLCARKYKVQPIPRSGGNSFEALSTGDGALVIDLSNMAAVNVNLPAMKATVQLGARMGNVYTVIYKAGQAAGKNLTCLGGVWPQVGFGGLMAAGGYGSLSRMYGVLADHVTAAKVVDAQGRVLQADDRINPDLFFAIRGGGGGTYGIVVEATVKLIEVPVVALGHIHYKGLDTAVRLMDRFQRWAPRSPRELTFTYNLVRGSSEIKLYYLGKARDLRSLTFNQSGLVSLPGAQFRTIECDVLGSRGWLAGQGTKPLVCKSYNVAVQQRVRPRGLLLKDREASKYKSALFNAPIPLQGLEEIKRLLEAPGKSMYKWSVCKFWKLFQWKAYGGVFDDIPASFNAFPHRKGTLMHTEFGTSFGYQNPAAAVNKDFAAEVYGYFDKAKAVLAKYESGARYNGYVSLDDNVASYFQGNYARLRRTKKKYDPENVFRNPLSVPPAAGPAADE